MKIVCTNDCWYVLDKYNNIKVITLGKIYEAEIPKDPYLKMFYLITDDYGDRRYVCWNRFDSYSNYLNDKLNELGI